MPSLAWITHMPCDISEVCADFTAALITSTPTCKSLFFGEVCCCLAFCMLYNRMVWGLKLLAGALQVVCGRARSLERLATSSGSGLCWSCRSAQTSLMYALSSYLKLNKTLPESITLHTIPSPPKKQIIIIKIKINK